MCGIAGFWQQKNGVINKNIAREMICELSHRGPDDKGFWFDDSQGIAFSHSRLSIIDLSEMGHQPMSSACGRYVVIFNGEIYNHKELRLQLKDEGYAFEWDGDSDTEVLLSVISFWGVKKALQNFIGMYAIALWDRKSEKLTLARDKLGEKPLYYGWKNGVFLFGSELKSLSKYPNFAKSISDKAVSLYFDYGYIPAPYSIYKDIYKLPPGHYITLSNSLDSKIKSKSYWSLYEKLSSLDGKIKDDLGVGVATNELDKLLNSAISGQMKADVPVGSFLSGGIDSTLVTAIMQSQSKDPISTFSIAFQEDEYNEADYAKKIAKYLGTKHTELILTPKIALKLIQNLSKIYDEPFSDISQIPTIAVSRLASEKVKVVLTGDAADEIFAGYDHYSEFVSRCNIHSRIPSSFRKLAAQVVDSLCFGKSVEFLRRKERLLSLLKSNSIDEIYKSQIKYSNPCQTDIAINHCWFDNEYKKKPLNDSLDTALFIDTLSYLPDNILVKVDRASMAFSLETRIPFLDHRIVEWAWTLPNKLKISNKNNKYIVKNLLNKYVPNEMVDRPKMGFSIPIGEWLRGDLKLWADKLLSDEFLDENKYLNKEVVQKMWSEHLTGEGDFGQQIWTILMFQSWVCSH